MYFKSWQTSLNCPEKNGTPLQCFCLENPMDRGARWAAVHGVATSWTWLSDFTFTFHFHALEKEMATHSSVLAWRIPGTAEPGGLPSMGSHRVRHDWNNLAAAVAAKRMHSLTLRPLHSPSLTSTCTSLLTSLDSKVQYFDPLFAHVLSFFAPYSAIALFWQKFSTC